MKKKYKQRKKKKKLWYLYGDTERKSLARQECVGRLQLRLSSEGGPANERGPSSFCRLASCLVGGKLWSDCSD